VASEFRLFDPGHLVTLAVILAACLAVRPVARASFRIGWDRRLAMLVAAVFVLLEIIKLWVFVEVFDFPVVQKLPLDLCRMNALLCAVMLVRRSYAVFEVTYFWTFAGSVAALLTPDLRQGFPHPFYMLFFFSHGLVLVAALFAIFAWDFAPRLRSVGKALLATALYATAILPLNYLLDANYLYLRAKPVRASVLDFFGPWPWYLLGLALLCVCMCLVCYAPFAWRANQSPAASS
jgi:hypothetical integral membrane protein (TIGR02206 family)